MKNRLILPAAVQRSTLTTLVVAIATSIGLVACGPQAVAPPPSTAIAPAAAPVVPPTQAPAQVAPAMPQTAVTPAPVPAPPMAQTPPVQAQGSVAQAGRPVPLAPADEAYPPVANPPPPAPRAASGKAPRTSAAATRVAVGSNRIGRVASIEPIREKPSGTGAGGVLGGVLGAVVGNRFGHGNGRAAMTVIGAAGGAVAGNSVERKVRERVVGYRVSVDLDNGDVRRYPQANVGDLQVGDRVKVEGQRLRRL